MTPAETIKALRLTTEEAEAAVAEIHIDHRDNPVDASWAGADAQYDKVLRGLVEWLEETDDYWHTKDVADRLREALGEGKE